MYQLYSVVVVVVKLKLILCLIIFFSLLSYITIQNESVDDRIQILTDLLVYEVIKLC